MVYAATLSSLSAPGAKGMSACEVRADPTLLTPKLRLLTLAV